MVVTNEVKSKVTAQINKTLADAKKLFGYNKPFPEVEYNVNGTCAGKAWYRTNKVSFNPVLLMENVDEFLARTVVHEVAHLIAWDVYLDKGHGAQWRRVMTRLGAEPKRCHSYDVATVRKTRTTFEYKCNCKTHYISTRMHNSILAGSTYSCRTCKSRITKIVTNQPGKTTFVPRLAIAANIAVNTTPVVTTNKKTNKQIVAELIVSNPGATRDQQIALIMNKLTVTKSNAGVYLYNYFNKK